MKRLPLIAALLAIPSMSFAAATADKPATVKVTQKYLVPVCLNNEPVKAGDRQWSLPPTEQSLVFTMRNEPREGTSGAAVTAGNAVVKFTPEAGHRYEVEVRAPAMTFTSRIWQRGEWSPVIRDRTVDHVVSSDPTWIETGCRR